MNVIYIILAVEDSLSEVVARKILWQSDKKYHVTNCLGKKGFGYLKSKIKAFNKAAQKLPFFVLTDQDSGCPPEKITNWLNCTPHSNLIFRIAVMEIESWVMADRKAIAKYLSISVDNFPHQIDEIADPKQFLISKAKKSKKRNLKEDIVPRKGSTAKIGPNYNACLSDFINSNWDVHQGKRI
jgi:hypothetical protein